MLEHLGWADLLRRWSGEAIAHADAIGLEVTPQMRASGWIGTPPASPTDIAAVESRLAPMGLIWDGDLRRVMGPANA